MPRHYLQITDEHFERAAAGTVKAVQNPVQQPAEMPSNIPNDEHDISAISGENGVSRELAKCSMGDEGLEPPTSTV